MGRGVGLCELSGDLCSGGGPRQRYTHKNLGVRDPVGKKVWLVGQEGHPCVVYLSFDVGPVRDNLALMRFSQPIVAVGMMVRGHQ